MESRLWWGYLHTNGHLQVKPYFTQVDIDDAIESPFVRAYSKPFEATGRVDALGKIAELLLWK